MQGRLTRTLGSGSHNHIIADGPDDMLLIMGSIVRCARDPETGKTRD